MEYHHQFAQQHDLGNGGRDANQDKNRPNSAYGLHISTIRLKLVLKSKPWSPNLHRPTGAKP
jgi:hypothetical protein